MEKERRGEIVTDIRDKERERDTERQREGGRRGY